MHTFISTAGPLLAEGGAGPWGGHGGGPDAGHAGGPFFLLIPLFWLLVLVAAAILFVRGRRRALARRKVESEQRRADDAWAPVRRGELLLAERFAQGDVDAAEYRERLEVLRAHGDSGSRLSPRPADPSTQG